jgi:predicted component of type VI protein secretion system
MYTLRLFHRADPAHELAARQLMDGELEIGRDELADWSIPDPRRTLSRRHCRIAVRDGELIVQDTSINGVFLGPVRLAPRRPTPVAIGETLRLGEYLILVEPQDAAAEARARAEAGAAFDAPFHHPILSVIETAPAELQIPAGWARPEAAQSPSDASLLDAFCAGARLDASAFAGEDPALVMQRLGEVYRQMVLGLSDVMGERTAAKSSCRLARTHVQAEGNNPFKWAAPQRLAVDLLRRGEAGFLPGPVAVNASFRDLKKHLLCMLAGMRAAIGSAIEALSPEAVEGTLETQPFLMKSKAAWTEYLRLHAEFRRRAENDPEGALNRAFVEAYERRLRELDSAGRAA